MYNIDDIFARLNLQQLQQFLAYGTECYEDYPKDYKQRIEEAWQSVDERLKKDIPDPGEYKIMTNVLYHYTTAIQDTCMEIGMQCGAVLAAQLFMRGMG